MSEMLSQEEIDALLMGTGNEESEIREDFNDDEKDAIGEIGNISMGTAATTLSTLLNNRVNITTPTVSLLNIDEIAEQYPIPFIIVDVKYKEGLQGLNVLILKEDDVKIITDLMMGGSGVISEDPISEIHLSAISEAMNQMVGASATSLSEMFNKKIDIFPPRTFRMEAMPGNFMEIFPELKETFVKISFKMVIGDLIDSEIMQLLPISFAKEIVNTLMNAYSNEPAQTTLSNEKNESVSARKQEAQKETTYDNSIPAEMPETKPVNREPVNVQQVAFQSFDNVVSRGTPENIQLIQDVPLNVTVELGRTTRKISEILEFGPGTIIELNKIVGEALDILINGQYVAKGEVVVIDENYGIRITDIVSPEKRYNRI
ncbi:MAG: flagellar motor switch phosphatase FliY [Alkaliphilus sp.]|nr:flagellar motor switch phosphatase FliY [Alkaliphilus transvaalensis]MBN4069860.1 flagellar motor switch phosphatase FliY [bacterium AH-315-G05]PHS35255.1 MAG: flagellar motor switch phosphatase FliY [Alkaliphilus sp.]